jgi:hypothetical protein
MPSNAILREVQQLYKVSDQLNVLAEEHPVVSEALITISGSVRNTAPLLEVLVATRMGQISGLDPASACCPLLAGKERPQATPRPKQRRKGPISSLTVIGVV